LGVQGANLIPPGGMTSAMRAPVMGYGGGRPDPVTEQKLAWDIRRAVGRMGADPTAEGGAPVHPNDLQMIKEDIRALMRGRAARR